jgi:hypothetical protein
VTIFFTSFKRIPGSDVACLKATFFFDSMAKTVVFVLTSILSDSAPSAPGKDYKGIKVFPPILGFPEKHIRDIRCSLF